MDSPFRNSELSCSCLIFDLESVMKNAIVGVDLAKNAIQVCINSNPKVRSNTEMTTSKFIQWLANSTPVMIIMLYETVEI